MLLKLDWPQLYRRGRQTVKEKEAKKNRWR